MREKRKEYLKVGEYIPENEASGTPEVIDRDYYRQGWIFKDEEAYCDKEHSERVCYIPELSDSLYTRQNFLDMCNGQEEFAKELFYACDWQQPETLMDEWIRESEWVICSKCEKLINYGQGSNDTTCPHCGLKIEG